MVVRLTKLLTFYIIGMKLSTIKKHHSLASEDCQRDDNFFEQFIFEEEHCNEMNNSMCATVTFCVFCTLHHICALQNLLMLQSI